MVLNGSEIVRDLQAEFERRDVDGFSLTVKGKGIVALKAVIRANGALFSVSKSYTLILDGPELKLQGYYSNTQQLIQVFGGTFIVESRHD